MKQKLGCSINLASRVVYQLPSTVLIALFYALLLRALFANQGETMNCSEMRLAANASLLVGLMSFVFSFFGFLPCCKFLLHQPGIRQMHQAMRYYHRAARPPNLIYVTDGGVQDCTGILQLMRRRRTRILLVLAAADPNDELAVLRTAMEAAIEDKIGSFYDPGDSQRDVRIMLEEFKNDKAQDFFKLGIRYGW